MAKEWTDAQEKKATPQQKKYLRELFPQNCSVLRADAAWRASSQQAGFGWTIKRQDVDVASFSTGSSVGSALTAEAMAMRQAIQEARILGHKRLMMDLSVKKLFNTVESIHDEMYYLHDREAEMQDLNRSTNSKMAWFSFLSLGVCLSVVGLQFWHLKSFFGKKKLI
ncbi:hypothetical protein F2Q69_00024351 [Brassica cretica]|uniref:GOLD domain-containing protein n=1 Tax=Brassica cretica TaxID=69181 RepID=A0A8S9Q7Z8_BRACR|nr:hypothetical protein F2Q69_00024351 [Brassica cretica]